MKCGCVDGTHATEQVSLLDRGPTECERFGDMQRRGQLCALGYIPNRQPGVRFVLHSGCHVPLIDEKAHQAIFEAVGGEP